MARAGWLDTNAHIDFPFVTRWFLPAPLNDEATDPIALPHSAIVDFGAIMGLDADYQADTDLVYLHRISRAGAEFEFVFRTTAAGAEGYTLSFTRNLTDPEFSYETVTAELLASSEAGSETCETTPVWEGYLVTGVMTDLANLLADGQAVTFDEPVWQIEPALIQSLTFLRSISLANVDRTHVTQPPGCDGGPYNPSPQLIFAIASCLDGDLQLEQGFNCSIIQDNTTNSITVGASVGSGAGQPCAEVPLYEGELPPTNSVLLSGGPTCQEVITTINGVGGSSVTLIGGFGIQVVPSQTDSSELVVTVSLDNAGACLQSSQGG